MMGALISHSLPNRSPRHLERRANPSSTAGVFHGWFRVEGVGLGWKEVQGDSGFRVLRGPYGVRFMM